MVRKINAKAQWPIVIAVVILSLNGLSCVSRPPALNDAWLDLPPYPQKAARMTRPIEAHHLFFITGPQKREAEHLLENYKLVPLSYSKVREFIPHLRSEPGLRIFLVRAVTESNPPQECRAVMTQDKLLWMSCEMLTHSDVTQVTHTPAVILLKEPPRDVLVTFSVAE